MTLKQLRKAKKLTQTECARILTVSLRTYQNYENDPNKWQTMKYKYLYKTLEEYGLIDEQHGILTLQDIIDGCKEVFSNYDIEYCYLFGSYAKGKASNISDVDLFVSTSVTGLRYFGLVEQLRERLKKKVDLLNFNQIKDNTEVLNEILKDGIKIYA